MGPWTTIGPPLRVHARTRAAPPLATALPPLVTPPPLHCIPPRRYAKGLASCSPSEHAFHYEKHGCGCPPHFVTRYFSKATEPKEVWKVRARLYVW